MKTNMALEKNHSTELAALELFDRILGYMDTGKIPISIFLDLSKAFDTLESYILKSLWFWQHSFTMVSLLFTGQVTVHSM